MKIPFFTHLIGRHNKKNTTSILVSGFTLIELMVATTIFTIIMLMGVGSLVSTSNAAKASQKLQIAVDNVNFAMESMTREIRMGTHYYCGTGTVNMSPDTAVAECLNGGNVILFKPQQIGGSPARIGYYKNLRTDGSNTYTLVRCVDDKNNCSNVVANNINVQELIFHVKGSVINDTIQPSVKIFMKGFVSVGAGTPFAIQSMASQRSSEK